MDAKFIRSPRVDADVQLLLDTFQGLQRDGRLIGHEEIEQVLKSSRHDGRYQTVTNRWRKVLMEEQRIFLDGRSALGLGFVSLTPDDMVRYSSRRVRSVGRLLKKAVAVASIPDESELREPSSRVYQQRLLVAIAEIATTHHNVVVALMSKPPRALPRAPILTT